MRRSKAPSMVHKSKRFCNNLDKDSHASDPEDESYNWGSKDNPSHHESMGKNKRIFNIVWRDITTKKHKTWKGDGTLEVNVLSMKAVLKDETGKYMGCTTKFQISDLLEDYQMMVGGKEIEIQNEIKDEEEIYELRKNAMKNRNWGSEEWVSPEKRAEEGKKPKGGFKFRPVLVLKQPQLSQSVVMETNVPDTGGEDTWDTMTNSLFDNRKLEKEHIGNIPGETKWGTHKLASMSNAENVGNLGEKTSNTNRTTPETAPLPSFSKTVSSTNLHQPHKHQDFMCFIKPSELQQYLFQQVNEYYTKYELNLNVEEFNSLDIHHILERICNHPSFIKHTESNNKLVQFLTSSLPDCSEMGPFDSGKLEFVQYFLQPSGRRVKENVVIIANNLNALNMLQGLCDYMNIQCLRINTKDSQDTKNHIFKEYCRTSEENATKVLLTTSILTLNDYDSLLKNQQIIVFENIAAHMNDFKVNNNLQCFKIYYLITAFSIEEFLILSNLENIASSTEEILNLFNTDFDDTFCYVHAKIKCNCCGNTENSTSKKDLTFFKNWQHLAPPFDEEFLKDSGLDNSSENLVTIFWKT